MSLLTGLLLCSCQSIHNETDPLVGEWLLFSNEAWNKIDGQIEDVADYSADWKISFALAEDGKSYVTTSYYKEKGSSSWHVDLVTIWTFIDNKIYDHGEVWDVLSLTEREMILEQHSVETYYDIYYKRDVTREFYCKQVYRKQ